MSITECIITNWTLGRFGAKPEGRDRQAPRINVITPNQTFSSHTNVELKAITEVPNQIVL
jgi:hypothetical protein